MMVSKFSIIPTLVLFSLLSSRARASVAFGEHRYHTRRQHENPAVDGSTKDGWEEMPDIEGASKYPNWLVTDDAGAIATMPLYQTAGQDNNAIKRAVIVLSGKGRDCWSYYNTLDNALDWATSQDSSIVRSEISLMAPCYWTEKDLSAGAAQRSQLIWGDMTWVSGEENVGPLLVPHFSSYQVLDSLVEQYMDRSAYPNLDHVVIAGHSAGAQMAQRYAALRTSTDNDDRLHFWIGNPGSLLWLTPDRPAPNDTCKDVDLYKYGLGGAFPDYATADAKALGREGLAQRYRGRNVHYAFGLADHGAGDTRCQAVTQGESHLERGQNYIKMLEGMEGGLPSTHTVDWIEGASHDKDEMMINTQSVEKLFNIAFESFSVPPTETRMQNRGSGRSPSWHLESFLLLVVSFMIQHL